jgi:hypothetical protein
MSLSLIREKLLASIKSEIYTPENKQMIEEEFLKPMIHQILDQMYPYFMWMGLFFMSMFVFIVLILCLNVKVLFNA